MAVATCSTIAFQFSSPCCHLPLVTQCNAGMLKGGSPRTRPSSAPGFGIGRREVLKNGASQQARHSSPTATAASSCPSAGVLQDDVPAS